MVHVRILDYEMPSVFQVAGPVCKYLVNKQVFHCREHNRLISNHVRPRALYSAALEGSERKNKIYPYARRRIDNGQDHGGRNEVMRLLNANRKVSRAKYIQKITQLVSTHAEGDINVGSGPHLSVKQDCLPPNDHIRNLSGF